MAGSLDPCIVAKRRVCTESFHATVPGSSQPIIQSRSLCIRSELPTTETKLKFIAAAAIIGLSSSPKNGYRRRAPTVIPSAL